MKKIVSLLTALSIWLPMNVYAYSTSDWAREEVGKAEEIGLITQKLQEADLTARITREEFAQLCVKAYEYISKIKTEEVLEDPFSDTDDPETLKAYDLGIIRGISETEFAPDALLVREEAAVMLARIYEKVMTGSVEESFIYDIDAGSLFADDDKISGWARPAVYFMAENGIIKGFEGNIFAPKNITENEKNQKYANTTREQAIILLWRMVGSDMFSGKPGGNIDPYGAAKQDGPGRDEDSFTVAFIGGSLTEGGSSWIMTTVGILQERIKDKNIRFINAGKGGTTSPYGAARFMQDVGQYKPDMVVIEFAVNDGGALGEEDSKLYMESMVRMCLNMEKIPYVLFLYAPQPVEDTTDVYASWEKGVKWKEQIAKHYGIKSINIYDYMQQDYKEKRIGEGYETFTDYLATMYTKSSWGFDVHGGYKKYSEAIEKAFKDDYEGCLTKPYDAEIYCKNSKELVNARYEYIDVNSPRMHYSGLWSTYTAESPFNDTANGVSINTKHYQYPYFTNGIKQSLNEPSAFGFMTKASAFCLNHISASAGSGAKVYIDMIEAGTTSCYSTIHGMNYVDKWISLPDDGKEHKVIVVVDDATDSNYVFRFGSIIERYTK